MRKPEIRVIIREYLGDLFDPDAYQYTEDASSCRWITEKHGWYYAYEVNLKETNSKWEGAGAIATISFREQLSKDMQSKLGDVRAKAYDVPRPIRQSMLDDYLENYTNSMHTAGIENFKVSRLKRFALLTQREKADISFENLSQLTKRLQEVKDHSFEQFQKFINENVR